MTKQIINIGTSANKGNGDPLRTAFTKVNENFTELYTALGLNVDGTLNLGAFEFTGSVMSTTDSTAITIDQATTVTSNLTVGGDILPSLANGGNLGSSAAPWRSLYVSNNTIYLGGIPLSLDANNNLTVNGLPVTGGGASVTTSATAPVEPSIGDLWYDTNSGRTYVYYDASWVDSSPVDGAGISSTNQLVNGTNTVSLGSDGELTLPGGRTRIGTLLGTDAIIANEDTAFGVVAQGTNGAVQLVWIEDSENFGTSNLAAVYVNSGGPGSVRIATGANGDPGPKFWEFNNSGALTFPNSGELRPSTAAYDSALAGWEFIRGGYITATINNGLVPPGGWPMVNWYPTGTTAQGYIDFLLNARTIQNTGGATLIIQPPMSTAFYNEMRASLIAIRDSYNASTTAVSLSSAYGQSWNFGTTGSLSLPAPAPITFTATLVPVLHAGGGGDAWYYTVIFQPNVNGDVETMISGGDRVWDHNPGYQSGDSWNFTQADHGIPGYTFTLTLGIVNDLGGGQWSANFATGEGPEYPSTVKSPATIKLSADNKNWTFGTDGSLQLPAGGTIAEGGGISGAIRITPAGGANVYQALLIYPTAEGEGDHIHLTAGGGTTDLYLGNDDQFVKIDHGGNVVVATVNANHWTFDTTGDLTLPTVITGTGSTVKSQSAIRIQAGQYYLYDVVSQGGGWSLGFGNVANFHTSTSPDMGALVSPGDIAHSGSITATVASVVSSPSNGGQWEISIGDPMDGAYSGGTGAWSFSKPGDTGGTWTFGTDGKLTIPGDITTPITPQVGTIVYNLPDYDSDLGSNQYVWVQSGLDAVPVYELISAIGDMTGCIFTNELGVEYTVIQDLNPDGTGGLTLEFDSEIPPGHTYTVRSPNYVAKIVPALNVNVDENLWTFSADGSLTLPGNSELSYNETTNTETISAPTAKQVTIATYFYGDTEGGMSGVTSISVLANEESRKIIPGWTIDFNNSNGVFVVTSVDEIPEGGEVRRLINFQQDVGGLDAPIVATGPEGTLELTAGSNDWTFGADGSLELPQGSTITDNRSFNNFAITADYTTANWGGDNISFGNASISLQNELSLLESGDFISLTTVRTGTITTTVANVYTGGAGGSLTVSWPGPGTGDSITSIELLDRTASGIELTTNSNTWTFGQSGELSLPAGGDVINSTGVSQLANRVEGSWTVATGTATYSFTVPSEGTYTMWVKGNIPNGIITWNATVSISNSNVPAIGQQYAWNYTSGGTPISLTAIPDQIRGSSGVISTDATYVGATSNRFDFGISNTSGSSQTIYYGYTKV